MAKISMKRGNVLPDLLAALQEHPSSLEFNSSLPLSTSASVPASVFTGSSSTLTVINPSPTKPSSSIT
jgi:hypothetical protein